MKILLITDTHGHLDTINELARTTDCDAVLHAGDFGFYDENSADRLSDRELGLHIFHSDLSREEKGEARNWSRFEKAQFVQQRLPLSDLPDYLAGRKKLEVPVYAVWGNHEDVAVVRRFHSGEYQIPNLHVLHERESVHLDRFHIFGLGGNVLLGSRFFQRPISGGGGRVWSVAGQYVQLLETVRQNAIDGEKRIFVSHVSPGKEPFISLIGAQTRTDFLVSGHMGPPFCMCWNGFAIEEVETAEQRLMDCVVQLRELSREAQRVEVEIEPLLDLPDERMPLGRGGSAPRWYREMLCLNLPDAHVGYALMEETHGRVSLITHSQ